MKIALTLSQLQKRIIVHLYFLTFRKKDLPPITEIQLRKELKKKSSLYNSLKSLVKSGYVMRTFKDGKYYYALSPKGAKIYELLGILSELGIDKTERERWREFLFMGSNPDYLIKDLRESRRYETMCCKCFGLTIVKEDRLLAKNNLCVRCRVEQERNKL
ncbi:hypothetical protein ES703_95047 [subsurface metagenome]